LQSILHSKEQNKPQQKKPTQTHCRLIGSQGLTDSFLSLKQGHCLGDARHWSTLTKTSEPVCLWRWREFRAWILKQKDHY